jgi:hypothetical protein
MAAGLRALASEVAAVAARLQSLHAATLCSALPAASHHLQHIPWYPCSRLAAASRLHAAGVQVARPLSAHAALAEEDWQDALDAGSPSGDLYERLPDHVPEAPLEAAALVADTPPAPAATAPAGTAAATAAAAMAAVPSDGDVQYPEGALLLRRMQEHYAALQATYPAYTARVSWDEFGARYLKQIEREEDARNRAWAAQQQAAAKDMAAGRGGGRRGTIATKLVQAWIPRLTEAIEAEQQQVSGPLCAWEEGVGGGGGEEGGLEVGCVVWRHGSSHYSSPAAIGPPCVLCCAVLTSCCPLYALLCRCGQGRGQVPRTASTMAPTSSWSPRRTWPS